MKKRRQPSRPLGAMFSEEKDASLISAALEHLAEQARHSPKKLAELEEALKKPDRILESAGQALASSAVAGAPGIYRHLKRDGPAMLQARQATFSRFEKRLYRTWKRPLDLLEMMIVVCTESAEGVNSVWPWGKSKDDDVVFDVVRRLQARACQVANEILTLLKAGYAPAAHARWRTLHETAVITNLIADRGSTAAALYLDHEHVEAKKAATQYQTYCRRLGYTRHSPREMANLRRRYNRRIKKYGKEFKNDYGWAAVLLARKRVTFADLEKLVELDHLRPFYKMASYPVHASVKSIRFSLALDSDTDVLLTGPSDRGLIDPGHSAAISLMQTTLRMLFLRPSSDGLTVGRVLQLFTDEIGDALSKAQSRVATRTRKK